MIRSFANAETEQLFFSGKSRRFAAVAKIMRRKLQVLDNTRNLNDLREPAGNRLEALEGDRQGQDSMRVNDRYSICFVWHESEPYEVELVDYH